MPDPFRPKKAHAALPKAKAEPKPQVTQRQTEPSGDEQPPQKRTYTRKTTTVRKTTARKTPVKRGPRKSTQS